jgi:hypothetical protein
MRMEGFEDWFAIRIGHRDDEIWPSRVVYDPKEGISLSVINFAGPELWYSNPCFEAETITGYLDYQRPATIIKPFIQSASPGSIGVDTQLVRARYRIIANGILKNFHLESLSDQCFTGLRVHLPSFHAWIAPQLIRSDYAQVQDLPSVSVQVGEPSRREFSLAGGVRAEVLVYSSAADDGDDLPVRQHTLLSLTLPNATDYETIMRIAAALDITFGFLVGTRLETAVCGLPTTRTRRWNDADETVTAESWIVPAWKRTAIPPHRHGRMSTEENSPVGPQRLLEFCVARQDDLTYLMNMVLAAEMHDLRADDCFVEILGCLEDFDKTQFGSGADPQIRLVARRIRRLVEQRGDEEERALCQRIGAGFRNEFSLRQRLERLIGMWSADGFRGRPDPVRLVQIRNMKPHGRGRELSPEVFREIVIFLPFLCALARYHVLRILGFDRAAIAASFARTPHRYGKFVPSDLIPAGVASAAPG